MPPNFFVQQCHHDMLKGAQNHSSSLELPRLFNEFLPMIHIQSNDPRTTFIIVPKNKQELAWFIQAGEGNFAGAWIKIDINYPIATFNLYDVVVDKFHRYGIGFSLEGENYFCNINANYFWESDPSEEPTPGYIEVNGDCSQNAANLEFAFFNPKKQNVTCFPEEHASFTFPLSANS